MEVSVKGREVNPMLKYKDVRILLNLSYIEFINLRSMARYSIERGYQAGIAAKIAESCVP
jgi:hypothetical protein